MKATSPAPSSRGSRVGDATEYVAPPTIARFFLSNADNRIIIGPFGSGKSSACTIEILRRAQMQEPAEDGIRRTRIAVIRNTYRELTDTTKATMDEWLPAGIATWVESDMTYWLKFNDVECEVMLRALDRPEDVKKLLSLDLTAAWINEAKQVPKSIFDALQGRVGRFPNSKKSGYCTWCGIFMDTNPPDADHWIYKTFEEFDKIDVEDRVNFKVFHQPSGLSPEAENIDHLLNGQRKPDGRPLYYAKMMPGKTKAWIDAFVHGQYSFVSDGNPVYGEYNDEVHCSSEMLEWRPGLVLQLGMDFGLTPALVIAQRIPGVLQWQVLDEITSEDMGAMRFAKHAVQYLNANYPGAKYRGWGDPAGSTQAQTDETTPFQVVQAAGLPIDPAPTNDPIRRREAVVGQLTTLGMTGKPSLIISPKAKKLRRGMGGGYHYARVQVSGEERFREEPSKNSYSHVCEALQYLMVGEGMDYKALDQGTGDDDTPCPPPKVHTAIGRSSRSPHGAR
jgi:hypothetical protein